MTCGIAVDHPLRCNHSQRTALTTTHVMLADDRPHHVPMSPAGVSPHLLANRLPLSPWQPEAAPPPNLLSIGTGDIKINGAVALAPTPIAHVEHSVIAGVSSPAVPATQIMTPAIAPTNTILALITASDGVCDKAPVLEFRLKAGSDNDVTATHRVRAYVFNQTVSEGAPLFKHSSMCGGRSHLFDLGALNLTYYGASAWEVATVGPLPRGGVSMIMIDSDGTCERFDVGTVAPFRPGNLPTLGGFTANVEPSKIRLVWAPAAAPKPPAVKRVASPAAPPCQPHLAVEPATLGQVQQTLAGMSAYLPLAPCKHGTRGIGKPRSKVSRRMAASLAFFFDRDNVRDIGPRAKSAPSRPVPNDSFRRASRPVKPANSTAAQLAGPRSSAEINVNDMLADLARSDQEVEGGNDDSVMDLVAALMEEEEDTHSRDAFDLADCLVNEFTRNLPTSAMPMPNTIPPPPPLMHCANTMFPESPSMMFSQSPFDAELPALMV